MSSNFSQCDVAIVGGGLAGGLIALALAARRPDLDVRVIEAGPRLGGNHIWSFFDSDVAPHHRWLVDPLVRWRWDDYDIAFPLRARTLPTGYNSLTGEALDDAVRAVLPGGRIIQAQAMDVSARHVLLDTQQRLTARHVIDTRGPGDLATLDLGWQKFVGQALTIAGGHGLSRPMVMDATVEQIDGFRFVYCLPLDADTVFVEDTYYSDTPDLDHAAIRDRIAAYVAARGWRVTATSREEQGVLPVVLGGDFDAYWSSTGDALAKAGLRAGLFHATTGYSLPCAVSLAAAMPDLIDRDDLAAALQLRAADHWKTMGFYRMLDTMLYRAADPADRYRVLQHFYRLPADVVGRFYAGRSTMTDRLRILSGKPPVPIGRAIRALLEKKT